MGLSREKRAKGLNFIIQRHLQEMGGQDSSSKSPIKNTALELTLQESGVTQEEQLL